MKKCRASIAGPVHSQVGQIVEVVAGAWPGFLDHALEIAYQGLDPLSELKSVGFYSRESATNGRCLAKRK